jgi:sulfur-carrier protein
MKLTVLYFARLREALARDRESIEVPATVATVGQLRAWLMARGEPFAGAFGDVKRVRAAVDQTMVDENAPLADGAEVAFFPPVTGG